MIKKAVAGITGALSTLAVTTKAFAQQDVTLGIDPTKDASDIVKIADFNKLISAVVAIILIVSLLAALLFLLQGGLQWITSGGDKAGVEAAQKKIQAALIGLVIVFSVWALFLLASSFLGVDIRNLKIPSPF